MDIRLIFIKVKNRLNKLDSQDNDNIQCWQFVEAFNKAQRDWCRRQLHGTNPLREGSEQSTRRVDDLQVLLNTSKLNGKNRKEYYLSDNLPKDYFEFVRISATAKNKTCNKGKNILVNFVDEASVAELLVDSSTEPSFEWGETFHTLIDNKVKVYLKDFEIDEITLTYYRQPKEVSLSGCENIDGIDYGNVDPEFKDDIVEVLIDETVAILAGDIESMNQYQLAEKRKEMNN